MPLLVTAAVFILSSGGVFADILSLYTETRSGHNPDTNWDWWQQDPCYPDPCFVTDWAEDALYLCPFDGAGGHPDDQPDYPIDGVVDGCYSTLYMGSSGAPVYQSLGVSGTNPNEFPNNQRDTRMVSLFNLSKVAQVNTNAGAILNCTFKWSVDYVMNWAGGTEYLQAPTTLYVSIYPVGKQEYWCHPPDAPSNPNTPISELQNEFDGVPATEKTIDMRVDDGPWGPEPNQPLTDYYIWAIDGPQYYEMDFTEELRNIIAENPDMLVDPAQAWIGLTIRPSLDGEACYLQMKAGRYPKQAFPPTLEIIVRRYLGDINEEEDEQSHIPGVDLLDFALMSEQWLQSDGFFSADLDVDEAVGLSDLILFCENWLKE